MSYRRKYNNLIGLLMPFNLETGRIITEELSKEL